MRINIDRLMADIESLGQVGRTTDGGVTRVAMSEADVAGRAWFLERVQAAGLAFNADGAGNLSAVLDVGASETICIGSHLDTVPNGGRYDGALGVLCGLEVLRTLHEAQLTLPVNVEAISFTDEEGGVYSMLGSRALTGALTEAQLNDLPDQTKLETGLKRLGITHQSILSVARDDITAFVEVHIEQGTRLEEQGMPIGIVPAVVGIRTFRLAFVGEAAHAGTMPMDKRRDGLWGVADFIQQGREVVQARFSPGVMNVGAVHIANAATNIVPANVTISLEFRHGSPDQLDAMETALLSLAEQAATQHKLTVNIERLFEIAPAQMSHTVTQAIQSAANTLGLSHTSLFSFAGHDAQTMARRYPTGMFFVPSVNGISHNPKEFSRQEDVENAANTLLHTVLKLAD